MTFLSTAFEGRGEQIPCCSHAWVAASLIFCIVRFRALSRIAKAFFGFVATSWQYCLISSFGMLWTYWQTACGLFVSLLDVMNGRFHAYGAAAIFLRCAELLFRKFHQLRDLLRTHEKKRLLVLLSLPPHLLVVDIFLWRRRRTQAVKMTDTQAPHNQIDVHLDSDSDHRSLRVLLGELAEFDGARVRVLLIECFFAVLCDLTINVLSRTLDALLDTLLAHGRPC